MKKTLALLLSVLLAGAAALPVWAQEGVDSSLEHEICAAYSPYLLQGEELLAELPDWLMALLLGGGGEGGTPENPTAAAPYPGVIVLPSPGQTASAGYEPGLYETYTVTKNKTYYDKNGAAAYNLRLTAVFVNTASGAICLKTTAVSDIYSGSWRITPGQPQVKNDAVSVSFQVEQLFTGIPVKTETVTLSLCASDRTGRLFSAGDVDGDGKLTTADARMALRLAVELEPLTDKSRALADLTGDGAVTPADARLILRKCIGL